MAFEITISLKGSGGNGWKLYRNILVSAVIFVLCFQLNVLYRYDEYGAVVKRVTSYPKYLKVYNISI